MLLAGNTGHEGGLTTLHANGVADVPARIEALAMLAGVERFAAHSLLASALGAVVHLHRAKDGSRRVAEIAVLERDGGGLVSAVSAVRWAGAGHDVQLRSGAGALRVLLEDRACDPPTILRSS